LPPFLYKKVNVLDLQNPEIDQLWWNLVSGKPNLRDVGDMEGELVGDLKQWLECISIEFGLPRVLGSIRD
jgi:hypothetical protein